MSFHREACASIYPHSGSYLPQRFLRSFSQGRLGGPRVLLPHLIQVGFIQNPPPHKILHRWRPPLPIHQSSWWQNLTDFSLLRLVSGAEETKANPKVLRVRVPSLLHTPGRWLFLECGSCACVQAPLPHFRVQSHVPVLHKPTHTCLHLITSAKRNPAFYCHFMESFRGSRSTL